MNDPTKLPKPKFKVGQVVVWKHSNPESPEFLLVRRRYLSYDGWRYQGHREIDEKNLRPLTKRERG